MNNKTLKPKSLRQPLKTLSVAALVAGAVSTQIVSAEEEIQLGVLQIQDRTIDTNPYAEAGAPYKAKISGDSRHVKPLAETPKTISVLTQTAIKESGKEDLRDILAAQPGVTLGTGENGNAFGDRYIIRGHEVRSDVFVDGLRDPGMTTRESFAVEQVEITKGPSSTFAGRGSTGGAINSITKQASTEYDFTKVEAGLGTDSYRRISLDSNKKISDDIALRANILLSAGDVPDRGPADKERTGIALSGSYQVTDKLNITADVYYLDAADSPDLGTYHISADTIAHDIPSYVQDEDFLESEVMVSTLRTQFQASDNVTIENALRYGTTENGYVTTGAFGRTRDASDPEAPGAETIIIESRAHQGWQEVNYFADQLNILVDADKHQLAFGMELSNIHVTNGTYQVTNNGATNCVVPGRSRGGAPASPSPDYCILDASGNEVDNMNSLLQRDITKGSLDSDFAVKTLSFSVMDTITFNDKWSLFLGARADKFNYHNDVLGRGASSATPYDYSDILWNGHVGLVYSLTENGNLYATYSTSSNINGGESDLGGNCGYGGLCGDDEQQVTSSRPEQTENREIGTKWNVMDEKLLITAAAFQVTKNDVMEGVGSDYESLGSLNTGKNRVSGVEVSLAGNITDKLSTQFGFTVMMSEILASETTNRDGEKLDFSGKPLSNFADESLNLQLRYQANDALAFGGTLSYSSEMFVGQPDSAAGDYVISSYSVLDIFASYAFSEQLNVRVNVGNVADTNYYLAGYRNGGFTYIGNARNAKATLSYEF